METDLPREARIVLMELKRLGGEANVTDLCKRSGIDQAMVMRAFLYLENAGLAEMSESKRFKLVLTPEGERYYKMGLPERRALGVIDGIEVRELEKKAGLGPQEVQIALSWLKRKNLITFEGSKLRLTPEGRGFLLKPLPEEEALGKIASGITVDRLEKIHELLEKRGLVEIKEEKTRTIRLTERGRMIEVFPVEEISEITPELLASGKWRTVKFKKYDVSCPVSPIFPAKIHPQMMVIEEVREILVGLGFKEVPSRIVETEFWNFDALFQAQDHPAREIHDTLSLKYPSKGNVPEELLKRVAIAHERGVGGSCGWGYKFDFEISRRLLLCSQTTATTVRFLSQHHKPPLKVFSIGRVFRHEKIDYKHLAEFYQCEGIVMDKGLTLRDMFGYLKEILVRLGFEKIKFRPSYFPYTEPSAEALVFHEGKGEWIEILGAGMFRPELLLPLGIRYPVLAWGIGLSRLIMLKLGIDDIRMLFSNDLGWLRKCPS